MSVIDTLITDRTTADVAALMALYSKPKAQWTAEEWSGFLRANHRGAYNASDLNRVGEAMKYVAAVLNSYGYSVRVSPKTWSIGELPTAAQLDPYLEDVRTLRAALTVLPTTPAVPADMEGLTVEEANAIEKILRDVDAQLRTMATTFVPCGGALCGGDYL